MQDADSLAEAGEVLSALLGEFRSLQAELREVQPPKGDEDVVDRILDDGDRSAERMAAAVQAAAANDEAGFEKAITEGSEFTDRAEKAATDYGFKVCARPPEVESDADAAGKVFDEDDFGITFRYPGSLSEGDLTEVRESSGRAPEAQEALGLDDDNLILVSKYVNDGPASTADLEALLPEFDELLSNLGGHPVTGKITEVGGFPSIRYDDVVVGGPEALSSRMVFVFDEQDQYLLNCQSTPARRQELDAACDLVLETLAGR